ncbi:MAG: hypothetical protein WC208_01005 [Gallionella sp.]|jgi:hypothetical protein
MNEMDRQKRLKRVALLCCHFIRNLAYYDAGRNEGRFVIPASEFNVTVNGNFLDICILEWCKLFGDHNEEHHWKNIVDNKQEFKKGLLIRLETDDKGLENYWKLVRTYRDEFVAHLDSAETMNLPEMNLAYKAVLHYFGEIIEEYQTGPTHQGIPTDLKLYYQARLDEAKSVYQRKT